MPLTKFLAEYELKLFNAVYHGKTLGVGQVHKHSTLINNLFKGERFISSLTLSASFNGALFVFKMPNDRISNIQVNIN